MIYKKPKNFIANFIAKYMTNLFILNNFLKNIYYLVNMIKISKKKLAQYVWINFMKNKKMWLCLIVSIFFIKIVLKNGSINKILAHNVERL